MRKVLSFRRASLHTVFILVSLCVLSVYVLQVECNSDDDCESSSAIGMMTIINEVRYGVDVVNTEDNNITSTDYESVASPGTVTIYGYCYYLDKSNTKQRIKYATVNLYDKTWYLVDRLLTDIYGDPCSTWTDSEGYYRFNPVENIDEFGGSGTLDVFIELVCDSGAVKVLPVLPINIWPYRGYSSVVWDVPNGNTVIIATCDDPAKKGCWGIYHSIIEAYQATEEEIGYRIPKINVVWPWPWSPTHFGNMWILQYIAVESGDEWDIDVVCHEYGHWVMHCLYGGNVPSVNYGSDGVHYWHSHETRETAWVEGWADFYSCAIRGDRYFWSYDLESQSPTGDDVEGAIACLLWDVYDSRNDGRDSLSLGLSPIWDVLKNYVSGGHHAFTIYEFWNGWLARGHDHKQKMWGIYYDHGINKDNTAPSNPNTWSGSHSLKVWSSDNTIEVSWSGASDDLSGVYGYSFVWDSSSSTIPDKTTDTIGTTSVSPPLSTGNSWYLHIRTRDNAGNWNPSASHIGPLYVDTSYPNAPSISESHCGTDWSTHDSPYFTWGNPGDQGSGIGFYEGSINGGAPLTVSSPYHATWSDGVYSFKVRSVDGVGLKSGWSNAITVKIDTGPPAGIVQINNGEPYTTSTSVTLTVEAVDARGSGVAQMRFRNEGESWGDWLTYATSTSWNLRSGDENKRVYVQFKDYAGVTSGESESYDDIILDTTPPSMPVPDDGVSGWSTDDTPTFTWPPSSDVGSGVVGYYWKVDTGSETGTTSSSVTLPPQSDGSHTFYVKAEDKAGFLSGWGSHDFQIDTTAPSTPNPDDGVEGWSTDDTPTFTWSSSSDSYSGVAGYYWEVDTGSETWTTSSSVTLPPQLDGSHTFYVKAEDNAGNVGSWGSQGFQIDTSAPSTPDPDDGVSGWSTDDTPTFTWPPSSDVGSGVVGYYWKVDTGSETGTTSSSVTLPPQLDGSHTFYVKAEDNAGNVGSWGSHDFQTDSMPPNNPNIYSSSHSEQVWSNDNTIDVEWSGASDELSSINGHSLEWSTSSLTIPDQTVDTTGISTTSPPLSDSDSWYFHVRTKDNAGNWAANAYHVGPFYIDADSPAYSNESPIGGKKYDNDTSSVRLQVDWEDLLSGVSSVEFRYKYGSGSWSRGLSLSGSSGDTFWYDIPQPEWINYVENTLYWESKATDNAGSAALTPAFTGLVLTDDDITPPEISNPSSSFITETDAYRLQIDASDPNGIGTVKFRYRFGTASYSEWYTFTSSSADTYWYDIPRATWETHIGETIHSQAYAEDSDDDRPNDYASGTSVEDVMFFLTVFTNPLEVDNLPADSGMGWYDADELAYAKCAPQVFVGIDTRSFFANWGGDATGNNPTSDPIVMDGPKTASANYKTQYRVNFQPKSHDGLLVLQPTQIQIYGAPPNDTLVTLTSYSEIWLDNVEWTAKQILWQGNNIVPDPNPQFSPTPSGTWVITCRVYKITSITFNDHSGKELYVPPTHVTITAPNATDISLSSFSGLVLYLQNGTYTFKTITWQSNNIAESPPQTFDATNGDPSINCRVYSLKVTCIDNSSQPLANASLTILFPNSTALLKYSNSDGFYYVPQTQNGSYSIAVDWQDVNVGNALINVDSNVDHHILCRVYTLTVRVRDEMSQPLSDTILDLYRNETLLNGKHDLPLAPATDDEGYYTWQQLSEQSGSYKVKAVFADNGLRKVGWSDEQSLTDDVTKKNAWSIQVIPIINVNVQTIDWEDKVLSGAYVEVILNKTVQAWGYTNLNGRINFTDIVPGNLIFNVYWMQVEVNQTIVNLSRDSTITLRCEVYDVVMGFKGADGNTIMNLDEYTLMFANGTERNPEVFAFRCPVGNTVLKSAIWRGTEVAPSPNPQINVNASRQYFFYLEIYNPTFSVKEPDGTTAAAYSTIYLRPPNGTIGSYPTDSNGQITLKIQRGSCYINVTTLDGYVAQVNYSVLIDVTKAYEIPTTQVLIDQTKVSSDRCDVDNVQTICLHAKWVHNGSDVVRGLICINETAYITNATGWISISISYDTVGRRTWVTTSVDCGGITRYNRLGDDPCIIWDRIKITEGGVTQSFTNITNTETVWFKTIYECDSVTFDGTRGTLYMNGSEMTWSNVSTRWEYSCTFDAVGERRFIISNVSDECYGLTKINNPIGPQTITWLIYRAFEVVFEGSYYDISIIANSAVSNFGFNSSKSQIDFEVSSVAGTTGTCNITIPKGLVASASDIEVYIDGKKIGFTLTESSDSYQVYVTYQRSTHVITISFAPSVFPWWILLVVIVVVMTAVALTVGRKRMKKQ